MQDAPGSASILGTKGAPDFADRDPQKGYLDVSCCTSASRRRQRVLPGASVSQRRGQPATGSASDALSPHRGGAEHRLERRLVQERGGLGLGGGVHAAGVDV